MRNNHERYLLVNRAIGLLSRRDFLRVKQIAPGFTQYDDFDDWYAEREGLQIGLSAAGVETSLLVVDFRTLLDWARMNALPLSESSLDRIAENKTHGNASAVDLFSIVAQDTHDLLHARLN